MPPRLQLIALATLREHGPLTTKELHRISKLRMGSIQDMLRMIATESKPWVDVGPYDHTKGRVLILTEEGLAVINEFQPVLSTIPQTRVASVFDIEHEIDVPPAPIAHQCRTQWRTGAYPQGASA